MIYNSLKLAVLVAVLAVSNQVIGQDCGCGEGASGYSNVNVNYGREITQSEAAGLWSNYCDESYDEGCDRCGGLRGRSLGLQRGLHRNAGCGSGCGNESACDSGCSRTRSIKLRSAGCGCNRDKGCSRTRNFGMRSNACGCGSDQKCFGYPAKCGCGNGGCNGGCQSEAAVTTMTETVVTPTLEAAPVAEPAVN